MKKRLKYPIVVEGKYDKNRLLQSFECTVLTLNGFSVFNSKEKQSLIRKIASDGIIVLVDPDGAGKVIRGFLNSMLPKDKIFNAYVPKISGKERRKTAPSKEGILGVEGMSTEALERALAPFVEEGERGENIGKNKGKMITKVDFYFDKLSGCEGAEERRSRLALSFGLPHDMTAKALLEALNIITDFDTYREHVGKL